MTLDRAFPALTRRSFLFSGTAAVAWSQTKSPTPGCTLVPEQEEGPYYIDGCTMRRNITEGKPGVPLQLRVVLVDAKRCAPLEHAVVDVWHCDALGLYSGFPANSPDGPPPGPPPGGRPPGGPRGDEFGPSHFGPPRMPPRPRQLDSSRYLRGSQISDNLGRVEFATLYPGWYSGRAIHIHVKVHLGSHIADAKSAGGHVCHTGQLFFPEEITADIAKLEPYANRLNVHRTLQSEDGVFTGQHGSESALDLTRLEKGSNAAGFIATVTLAVDPGAAPAPMGPFGLRR